MTRFSLSSIKWNMSKIVLIILCSILAVNAQYSSNTNQVCKQRTQQIAKTLTADNPLFQQIELYEPGDGILKSWMSKMKSANIKHAAAVVGFDYQGQEVKLSLQAMSFYNRYYDFGSEAQIRNVSDLDKSLNDELKLAFFNKALELMGSHKIENKSCGKIYLHLLDDACLPIIYNTSTVELGCSEQ